MPTYSTKFFKLTMFRPFFQKISEVFSKNSSNTSILDLSIFYLSFLFKTSVDDVNVVYGIEYTPYIFKGMVRQYFLSTAVPNIINFSIPAPIK